MKNSLTFNDLKNIDFFLLERQKVVNIPQQHKDELKRLREKITNIMDLVKVKVAKGGSKHEN